VVSTRKKRRNRFLSSRTDELRYRVNARDGGAHGKGMSQKEGRNGEINVEGSMQERIRAGVTWQPALKVRGEEPVCSA